jgi:hypothetical protein
MSEFTNEVAVRTSGKRVAGLATAGQSGRRGAKGVISNRNERTQAEAAAFIRNSASRRHKPAWDSNLRELRVGKLVIKRFRKPACNQVTVLASFQELRWCRRIDDPLPGNSGSDPKRRLRDTVFTLNRHHVTRNILVFEADGTGRGVIWNWHS